MGAETFWMLWALSGIVIHIICAIEMKTWCGTPVWREPSTYVMFIPAMIGGPLLLIARILEPPENGR